ncbi:hypothetical protein QWY85_18155 [Neolewinella lacunae]|uniref:Anti-sigma factor n=1 Tax=Neolewinella lacunae TaxID=1517758 RepID=A0A923T9M7_9BACT|nr:hypothetical protein [Neolewinella lacunae]MBC6995711.1 hypothetical protein [Neolewinella lacunae]MDN3636596.1 hypothetical protein [Neolewinella lacunae]
MNQDDFDKHELLEQYVLGLTNREESEWVEDLIAKDPEARKDLEHLRKQLEDYADGISGIPTPAGRPLRNHRDFADLDQEMIVRMTERNHTLVIWRYALSVACLLLVALCGFLFRSNQTLKQELLAEKARHAQDGKSFELQLKNLQKSEMNWDSLKAHASVFGINNIRVHYLERENIALLDLSRVPPPDPDYAYYLIDSSALQETKVRVIGQADLHHLFPIHLPTGGVRIYHLPEGAPLEPAPPTEHLYAEISLLDPTF